MNFVDRQLLSSFANYIVPDLGLSNTEFGLLTGLVFLVFYSVMGLFMGFLADTMNRTRLIAFGLALWSGLTALSGAAKGFWSLAAPRMFIGVGESIMTPTSMSLLADRFPSTQLGFASGVYYMGVPIGVGVSLLIVGYLGPAIGWRNCFYLLGALGLLLAIVMLFIRETPRRHLAEAQVLAGEVPKQSFGEIVRTLFRALRGSPALCLTIAGGVALHLILGAAAFDQLWYAQERGFDRDYIARMSGWIAMVAGIAGNLFGGLGSDWYLKRTGQGRPMFLFWIMLLLAPLNIRLPDRATGQHLVLDRRIRRLLSAGLFLWSNFLDGAGAGPAADSSDGSGLLHSVAQPGWHGDRHHRRRDCGGCADCCGGRGALQQNVARLYGGIVARGAALLSCRQTLLRGSGAALRLPGNCPRQLGGVGFTPALIGSDPGSLRRLRDRHLALSRRR